MGKYQKPSYYRTLKEVGREEDLRLLEKIGHQRRG
jgi:hypothetical protein